MGLLEFLFRPRAEQLPPGEYDCELTTLFTPQGPDEGPVYFKVLAYLEPPEPSAHFGFELTPDTVFLVDGTLANRSSAMAALDEEPHFTVVVVQPGYASELHVNSHVWRA